MIKESRLKVFRTVFIVLLILGLGSVPNLPSASAQTNFPVTTTAKGEPTPEGANYLEQTVTGVFEAAGTLSTLTQTIKNSGSTYIGLVNISVFINDELVVETNPDKTEQGTRFLPSGASGPLTVTPNRTVAAGDTVTIRYLYEDGDISTELSDISATGEVDESDTPAEPSQPEPIRNGNTWTLYDGTVTTVTPGNNPKVTITHPITASGTILGVSPDADANQGYFWAYLEAQNGYDLDGNKDVVIRVLNTAGREVYRNVAKPNTQAPGRIWPVGSNNESDGYTNGYGGIADARMPLSSVTVEAGYTIVVELQFKYTGKTTAVESDFRGPVGPGYVKYQLDSVVPNQCTQESPFQDRIGDTARRPSGSKTSRQPARELTEAERARGTSVYVTAADAGPGVDVSQIYQARRYSTLYRQERVSGKFTEVGYMHGWIVNALAYNKNDNYLYAISQGRVGVDANGKDTHAQGNAGSNVQESLFYEDPCYPAGHLLQINPETAEVIDLGKVGPAAGSTTNNRDGYGFQGNYSESWPNDLWGGINAGFFDANGDYWVSNASVSGTGALYKVDLNNVTAHSSYNFNTNSLYDRRYQGDMSNSSAWRAHSEDYSILMDLATGESQGNYAWGVVNSWNSDGRVLIERINMSTGESRVFDITGLRTVTGQRVEPGHQWSKAWVYPDGTLGFGTGSNGANSDVFRLGVINPTSNNPTFSLQSVFYGAPIAYNTNGTSNGSAGFKADLETQKRKSEVRDGRMYWWIDAWNNGPDGLSGFALEDKATTEFGDLKVEQVIQAPGLDVPYVESVGNNAIQMQFGSLPARKEGDLNPQISVLVSAAIGVATNEKCVENKVTVVNNENDPEISNNTFTTSCDVEIEKTAVDTNNDGTIDAKDVSGPDADGNYSVTYDVKVTNTGTAEAQYAQIMDTPRFDSEVFTLQGVSVVLPGTNDPVALTADPQNPGTYRLGGPGRLAVGASHTYRVTVTFTADQVKLATNPELGKCSDDNTGLVNSAALGSETSEACVPFPTSDKLPLKIVKLEANGDTSPIPGAEFGLYRAAADGSFIQNDEYAVEISSDGAGEFTADIDAPGVYWLVETKAPAGLSLLAEPVKFSASWDDKMPVILVQQGGSSLIKTSTEAGSTGTFAVLQVADIKNGELPKTGGLGIWLFALAGLLICGFAAVVAVRRK